MGIIAHCCVCNEYIPQPHNKNRRYRSARCYMAKNRERYGYVRKENRAKRRWAPEDVLRWAMALADDHGAARWRRLLPRKSA